MVTFLFLFSLLSGTEKSVVNPYLTVDLQSYLYRTNSAVSKAQLITLGATSTNKFLKMAYQKVNPPHTFHTVINLSSVTKTLFNSTTS